MSTGPPRPERALGRPWRVLHMRQCDVPPLSLQKPWHCLLGVSPTRPDTHDALPLLINSTAIPVPRGPPALLLRASGDDGADEGPPSASCCLPALLPPPAPPPPPPLPLASAAALQKPHDLHLHISAHARFGRDRQGSAGVPRLCARPRGAGATRDGGARTAMAIAEEGIAKLLAVLDGCVIRDERVARYPIPAVLAPLACAPRAVRRVIRDVTPRRACLALGVAVVLRNAAAEVAPGALPRKGADTEMRHASSVRSERLHYATPAGPVAVVVARTLHSAQ